MVCLELLATTEMARADRLAVAGGVSAMELMENAGAAVARQARSMLGTAGRIAILCGRGGNGGDGFVAARLLAEAGYRVRLYLLGTRDVLGGATQVMADRWTGKIEPLAAFVPPEADLIIDGLFGAGLSRAVEGEAAIAIGAANASGVAILAIDVPSGVWGDSGHLRGVAITATQTITFFRRKPGHLLLPGRELCGRVSVADIAIPSAVLDQIKPQTWANEPGLWGPLLPSPKHGHHKYHRGHGVVVSGPVHATGAARLGARGALRIGAGLVTVASPLDAVAVNASQLTAIMVAPFDGPRGLGSILSDARRNAVLIGPGSGVTIGTRLLVQVALEFEAAVVIDADGLISFTLDQDDEAEPVVNHLFALIKEDPARPVVITPHEGEFAKLFPDLVGSKLERARAASVRSGAVVVLKGADSVIAAPDGRAAINANAPAWLATAGSGDVLAGFIMGLLAQGMPDFEAACAAVWMHGASASAFGPGLIAEDLPKGLPRVLKGLLELASP